MLFTYPRQSYVCTYVIATALAVGVAQPAAADTTTIENPEAAQPLSFEETTQFLKKVKPMPFYDEASDPDALPSHLYAPQEELGPPGFAPGGLPGASGTNLGSTSGSGTESGPGTEFEAGTDFGTQDTGDFFAARRDKWSKTRFPWQAVGKLLIATTTPNQFNSSCSASVISPNNIIVTAAHCCYSRSAPVGFFADWRFIPGAHNNQQPFGVFDWASTTVLTGWINNGGRHRDVCLIALGPNAQGQGVSSRTGWLGRSWNQPQTEHVFTFGYPGNVEAGRRQAVCASENYPNCGSGTVNATGCNKTFGDSGAPWIRVYRPRQTGANNFVNSVTSGWDACTGTFGLSYNGARFRDQNIVRLCNTVGC